MRLCPIFGVRMGFIVTLWPLKVSNVLPALSHDFTSLEQQNRSKNKPVNPETGAHHHQNMAPVPGSHPKHHSGGQLEKYQHLYGKQHIKQRLSAVARVKPVFLVVLYLILLSEKFNLYFWQYCRTHRSDLKSFRNGQKIELCQQKVTQLQKLAICPSIWTKKRVVSEKGDTTPKVGKSILDFDKKSSCVGRK
ncbi:MAG: hypothetical protein QM296_08985 [Bacillota bacterium]|nr:hypothetical protein [Bacillota bacterium]